MTDQIEARIIPVKLEEELNTSFLDYSMSFILSRALPDGRDGLKPSQRRILVAMNELSPAPNPGYRESANNAGGNPGNYDPHGEAIAYAFVMHKPQDFRMGYPLVRCQGNFGSTTVTCRRKWRDRRGRQGGKRRDERGEINPVGAALCAALGLDLKPCLIYI